MEIDGLFSKRYLETLDKEKLPCLNSKDIALKKTLLGSKHYGTDIVRLAEMHYRK